MKKLFLLFISLLFGIGLFAQTPQAFKYQAVARDATGGILANKPVTFKISIIQGTVTGAIVYTELHGKTTNVFGLIDLEIGKGTSPTGTFSSINWGTDMFFIKVEMDPLGGIAFQNMGTSQLLSVPYALYAKDVQNKDDADADPINEIQSLSVTGTNLILSKGGGTVAIPGDNWGMQVAKTNNTLSGQGTTTSPLGVVNTEIKPMWGNIQSIPLGFADGVDNVNGEDTRITSNMITNWNTAFGWGNHSGLYKLSSYVPVWTEITGKPTFATVATSGNYSDLLGKPTTLTGYGITDAVTITGDQTITGIKTFSKDLLVNGLTIGRGKNAISNNTAIGDSAIFSNTTGKYNTATGYQALHSNTTGYNNTANGFLALHRNTTGFANTANGAGALHYNTTGNYNTANGLSALYSSTTGSYNTANSDSALFSNTTGNYNIANGYAAGYTNTAGNYNVFLGSRAGYYETGSNKLYIDNQPRASESDARAKALIYGVFDADPANQVLSINGNINVNSNNITNVANPLNAQDAATKAYVDAIINKLSKIGVVVADVNGNIYPTVRIGSQIWMAENLKTTKFNDGTAIPLVTDNTEWSNQTTPGYCWYNNDQGTYGNTYGMLYNWYTVNTGKLCPAGWHLPSYDEWTTLSAYLGGQGYAGGKLKESDTIHWSNPNTGATNETGFLGLPGGGRWNNGSFSNVGRWCYFWSSSDYTTTIAWFWALYYGGTSLDPHLQ